MTRSGIRNSRYGMRCGIYARWGLLKAGGKGSIMSEDTRSQESQQDEADTYSMVLEWDSLDRIYVVTVPELPGCMTHGRTAVEAVGMGHEAIEGWIAFERGRRRPVPPPRMYPSTADITVDERTLPADRVAVS